MTLDPSVLVAYAVSKQGPISHLVERQPTFRRPRSNHREIVTIVLRVPVSLEHKVQVVQRQSPRSQTSMSWCEIGAEITENSPEAEEIRARVLVEAQVETEGSGGRCGHPVNKDLWRAGYLAPEAGDIERRFM